MDFVVNTLTLTVRFAVTLMIASMGEMFNQKAGIFNLGCEGIMSVGAFLGMLIPFTIIGPGTAPGYVNILGLVAGTVAGCLLGLLFGVIVITFRAPQGIAGIGMQMFGVGLAGTFFRSYIGGTQSITGISSFEIPLLSKIPVLGKILFTHNPLVYFAYLLVPVAWYVIFKTPWGLKVRAVGTHPRAADSLGINVTRIRFQSLAVGGAMAGFAGAFLTLCQAKMFNADIINGRGFIAVALVYFGQWHPIKIFLGALLFTFAQTLQTQIQIFVPQFQYYEFLTMLPYILVIVVLAFNRKSNRLGPTALGRPFNREMRV
ncbi:MAG: ABC transporter permease [Spirochaetales bacterium]|nr:ABC transporter permease [Spirochaetales bacterium]MCR5442788.1 ABC transporter permease [Sphaerochaetaceae bacterium]MBQ3697259.1 ABC transporter permease [Spirochaetales bacterium]MBQ3728957.1 ABC transporter permease [Spirochaetales bacterium]MBQ3831366.1 ABC transporter permease [Spirochaetales bacterium]